MAQDNIITFRPELPEGYSLAPDGKVMGPDGEAKVLLHCCCAPCSSAILEWMVGCGMKPCIFFSNSNIVPFSEYEKRKEELVRYAASYGLEVVDDDYSHSEWLEHVRKLEKDSSVRLADIPERGARCLECFRFRLLRAASYAVSHGYRLLTTTLASSRWKDLDQVDEAGIYACNKANYDSCAYNVCSGTNEGNDYPEVVWWGQNWRKGGLQPRRSCLVRELGMYNQDYCGCEFSIRNEE